MQEHIRRAHPDYYIPKLPATEESFQLMISTPPSARPPPQQPPPSAIPARRGYCKFTKCKKQANTETTTADASEHDPYASDLHGFDPGIPVPGQPPAAANAAVALTQLGHWDTDFVSDIKMRIDQYSYPTTGCLCRR